MKRNSIKLFEDKLVRSVWDDEKEEWFFSVNDVVQILTDSANVSDYIKKMRKRDEELGKGWGQIVTLLSVSTAGGMQKTNNMLTNFINKFKLRVTRPCTPLNNASHVGLFFCPFEFLVRRTK